MPVKSAKAQGQGFSCRLGASKPLIGVPTVTLILMLCIWDLFLRIDQRGVGTEASSSVFGDWPPPHTVHVQNNALASAASTRKRYSKGEMATMRGRQQQNQDFFTTQSFFSHTAKCFSCMSKFYEAVWPALTSVYKRPLNFTDKCNEDILEVKSVPVTHCPTICVGMWEEIIVGGVKIRGHIRGCMDDLLHNGFNQTIVAWYRWMARDSCREYRKRELFKLGVGQSDESSIHLCTCYADHCNHAASPSAASSLGATSLACISLLLLLVTHCPLSHSRHQQVLAVLQPDSPTLVVGYVVKETMKTEPMDSWQKRKRR